MTKRHNMWSHFRLAALLAVPPTITTMSSRPSFLSSAMICGTSVR